MFRRKKLIWWEHRSAVGSADDARQRGSTRGHVGHRHEPEPYYGPVTVGVDLDGADDPVARRDEV